MVAESLDPQKGPNSHAKKKVGSPWKLVITYPVMGTATIATYNAPWASFYQKPKYLVPKMKVFIDFLVENLMGKHD